MRYRFDAMPVLRAWGRGRLRGDGVGRLALPGARLVPGPEAAAPLPSPNGRMFAKVQDTMTHPIQRAIDSLYEAEACPRLHIDVTLDDVVCPDAVRNEWKDRLIIDLDPNYPMNLEFTDIGIEADLVFGDDLMRCTFPWKSIYVVANRATGERTIIEENLPAALRSTPTVHPPRPRPVGLRVASDPTTEARRGSRRRRRHRPSPTGHTRVEPAAGDDAARSDKGSAASESADSITETSETSETSEGARPSSAELKDQEAKRRRAIFRVIDGGT